jgi:hypothetical protein
MWTSQKLTLISHGRFDSRIPRSTAIDTASVRLLAPSLLRMLLT